MQNTLINSTTQEHEEWRMKNEECHTYCNTYFLKVSLVVSAERKCLEITERIRMLLFSTFLCYCRFFFILLWGYQSRKIYYGLIKYNVSQI